MAVDTQQIKGFDDLAAKLRAIVPAMRKRVLRNALAAGGRIVRDSARSNRDNTPRLHATAPYRTAGLIKKSIVVRTSKNARRAGDVGVFVNVRPAKSGMRGAKSKTDPFYWRFLEFGTKKMAARPFLKSASSRLPAALAVFQEQVGKWIAKTSATGRVQP